MISGRILWRCLFGGVVVLEFILSLFFCPSSSWPVTLTVAVICNGAFVIIYLSTVIVFVIGEFDRFQTGKRGDRFLALFNLSMFPIIMILFFATIYKVTGLFAGDTIVKRPIDFLYFSIITWTTLGYGDIKPSLVSRMFAASEALLGYLFMGLYIAVIFNLITERANKGNL